MLALLRQSTATVPRVRHRFFSSTVGEQQPKRRIPFTLVAWVTVFCSALYWMVEDASLEEPLILPAESSELQRSLTERARQRRYNTAKKMGDLPESATKSS